ncbi:MAG: Gfo/Idh/MocA family protein [Candidatus Kapaibacteriota bacterium]
MKICVIGVGHLGMIHARLLKQRDDIELSIYDPNAERAEFVSNELQVPIHTTIDSAIAENDAVIIAASTTAHFTIAKKAIESGKHCFIEKPITSTYHEALELINLADHHKVIVQVGHVERFNPALLALQSYSIEPLFIEAHRLAQFKPRATDVSVIHDLMIHDIDIVLWMVKSPVKHVDANAVNVITETADIANARITFENGCVANITASRISAQPMRKMRVFQKSGYMSIDFAKPSVDVYRMMDSQSVQDSAIPAMMLGEINAGNASKAIVFEQPPIPTINAIAEEHSAFIRSIQHGDPIAVTVHDAAEALRIAELIANVSH